MTDDGSQGGTSLHGNMRSWGWGNMRKGGHNEKRQEKKKKGTYHARLTDLQKLHFISQLQEPM